MSKPKVNVNCVASNYQALNERIIEVSSDRGGCLISLHYVNDRLVIDIYRADDTVDVRTGVRA